MSHATDLVQAILREHCAGPDGALSALDTALELEVDPLDHFACAFGLGCAVVYERAAGWAGLMFSAAVPLTDRAPPRYDRLDSMAELRTLRVPIRGHDISFMSPSFTGFLRLRNALDAQPELRLRICVVPGDALRAGLAARSQQMMLDESRQRLARRWPFASAHLDLPLRSRVVFVAVLLLLAAGSALAPLIWRPILLPPLIVLIGLPALLRIAAVVIPDRHHDPPVLGDGELPVYTVLIPLRDEANMVAQLRQAMSALDYPASKLDIKFVVEAKSAATVEAVRAILGDPRFELVVVPDADPRTKPKALNYALPLVRGQHVTIYDAEDIPHPRQLRDAAERFAADPSVDCLQAEIEIDNATETWLTALFAGEYAGLFGLLLPLLSHLRLPMPLGGTSNHFRTGALREAGGWDAFNVTEDADLGVRLARLRYRCGTLRSRTREEAPCSYGAWLAQRSRWMKGWMQTFIVHNRSPRRFLSDIGWRGFLVFEIYVGGLIVSPLLHSVFMLTLVTGLATGDGVRDIWGLGYFLILLVGYGAAFLLTAAGLWRAGKLNLLPYQFLLPIYWVLHSIATLRACYELITRPYFWAKTMHGQTSMKR